MATPLRFASMLFLSSALIAPAALAQSNAPAPANAAPAAAEPAEETPPEVSLPGGDIVVVGRGNANVQRSAPAVVSVLSTADIARTGEGNIAGALGRVTGLSVVGGGFVYVRGLGDRYSLALLNGSPLPSPEPLKRSIPLDLFPTNIVASSLVQKSYSVNFPGEFGGGVINLTTNAVPKEKFLTLSVGGGFHSETTGINGYTYYGGKWDWTGFDNGSRNTPPGLAAYYATRQNTSQITDEQNRALAGSLITPHLSIVQREGTLPPNFSGSLSGGTSFELGSDTTLGLIATAGYSNKFQTRDAIQQFSSQDDLSFIDSNFERVSTTDRVVVNGLLGLGLEFGDNKIRGTNLFIRDTLKSTRVGLGTRSPGTATFQNTDTAWYERQLIDSQLVGEFKPMEGLSLDVRAGFANSQREAPAETTIEYFKTNNSADPYGDLYQISLTGNVGNRPRIAFSDLDENLWSAGADLTYKVTSGLNLSVGYAYQFTKRVTLRREFQLNADNSAPTAILLLRPDLLFSPGVINSVQNGVINPYGIEANEVEPNPKWRARLLNHAGYAKLNWQATPEIQIDAGVRYEWAREHVGRASVFASDKAVLENEIKKHYWLPAGTITWEFQPGMQLRVNASKTIARPQFRELVVQPYFDPETNRTYRGNRFLTDSELINAEARYEWYFARDQRLSLAGFYKHIDRPIESYLSLDSSGNSASTYFANAPKANLWGVELEAQKYIDLSTWSEASMFASRRLVLIGNYTYTKSKLKVSASDTTIGGNEQVTPASAYFRNGAPLTGQSDHLVNLQVGMEDTDKLSQQTLILSYASKRVTSRGVTANQPDVFEHPGFNLDFVWRQGVSLVGRDFDVKFEARNLLYNKYKEYQQFGSNRVNYNYYNIGTTFNLSVSTTF